MNKSPRATLGALAGAGPESPVARCAAALIGVGAGATRSAHAFFVPGRIEVFGKHTDYAGGRSLLAAVERGFTIVGVARDDARITFTDVLTGESTEIGRPAAPFWSTYPETVCRRLARNFPDATDGADVAFLSDLPPAAGLSSSSAFVVASFLVLDAVRDLSSTSIYRAAVRTSEQLAEYLGAMENGWDFGALRGVAGVGTHGGSEDHTAMLCARAGHLVQYRFAPVSFERAVAMPADHVFGVASSGVRAEKAGATLAHYNQLAAQTRRLVELWRSDGGREATLGAIVAAGDGAVARLRTMAAAEGADLAARLDQFAAECEHLIPAAAAALARGDVEAFGAEAARSSDAGARALRNQAPETGMLVEAARRLGAAAASQFGAGFGGSVWALVRRDRGEVFLEAWRNAYAARFPGLRDESAFFLTEAGGPATRLA